MSVVELRDSDAVREYVVQGLWLQRLTRVEPEGVFRPLAWAFDIVSLDEPLPPIGFVADAGRLICGHEDAVSTDRDRTADYLPAEVSRAYEDYVLGKLYADATFERGSTAVCRYQKNDRDRGVAWMLARFRERADAGGIRCSPGVIRSLSRVAAEDLLTEGSSSIRENGLMPLLLEHYESLTSGARGLGDVLAAEDVFELEHETALVEFGQRLALRQVLAASAALESVVPRLAPGGYGRDRNVATNLCEEDSYPVGGFTSISTRGTIESLLHSQLAYMEPVTEPRPDLFDIKFLRSELLYYSRDENEFLRRRRTFVFALYSDLVDCRVKDADMAWQRIVVVLAMLVVSVRQLIDWLTDESLMFRFVFVTSRGETPLADERELVTMLLREQIENGTVAVEQQTVSELEQGLAEDSRRTLTHCLLVSGRDREVDASGALLTSLQTNGQAPVLQWDGEPFQPEGDGMEAWQQSIVELLRLLV